MPLGGNEVVLDLYSCFGKCQRGVNVLVRENLPTDNPMMLRLMPTAGGRATLYHRVVPAEAQPDPRGAHRARPAADGVHAT